MKKCPKCGSVTDAEYECKICGESICYEPYVDSNREHIAKGYRFRYWMAKLWLPIAASIGFGIALAVYRAIDRYVLMNAVLVVLSWLLVIFRRHFIQVMLWKYNEDYAKFDTAVSTVVLPAASIFMSVVLTVTK